MASTYSTPILESCSTGLFLSSPVPFCYGQFYYIPMNYIYIYIFFFSVLDFPSDSFGGFFFLILLNSNTCLYFSPIFPTF